MLEKILFYIPTINAIGEVNLDVRYNIILYAYY